MVGVCHQGDYHINISLDDTISNREVDTNLDGILSDEEFRASLRKRGSRDPPSAKKMVAGSDFGALYCDTDFCVKSCTLGFPH